MFENDEELMEDLIKRSEEMTNDEILETINQIEQDEIKLQTLNRLDKKMKSNELRYIIESMKIDEVKLQALKNFYKQMESEDIECVIKSIEIDEVRFQALKNFHKKMTVKSITSCIDMITIPELKLQAQNELHVKTNEVLRVLENRRSCRKFKPDMITKDELDSVIRAGTYAPTGMGKQSPIIIAVTDKELRKKLAIENAKIAGWKEDFDPFYGAPVVLIVLADKSIWTYKEDGSLVLGNMLNAAESLGLGSIWIHRAKEEFESDFGKEILKSLGISGEYEGIGHCALGYRDGEKQEPAPRKENYVYMI